MSLDKKQWEQELGAETRSTNFQDTARRVRVRTPGLTILGHPDSTRVGEEAALPELLAGGRSCLSRLEPRFATPASEEESRPLAHVHISRKPMLLLAGSQPGSFLLDRGSSRTKVSVEGQLVETRWIFTAADIERGAVFILGNRIVLLLHWLDLVPSGLPHFGLVGASGAINRLRQEIRLVADLDVPILLRGETGTGKELVAQAIHQAGERRDAPCVAVNIGAIPPTLAASELFGAARGAFTGADRKKTGFFERADGGSLFLDEVGETPAEVQVLLLRALENHQIQPVGSVETHNVDVRIIAATDADLESASALGRFRAPLLHRLAGYELHVPPLRGRRGDIGRLLFYFLRLELEKLGDVSRLVRSEDLPWPPAELVARLARYDWPGNVRQLRNVARRLAIASQADPELGLDSLIDGLLKEPQTPAPPSSSKSESTPPDKPSRTPRKAAKSYRPPHEVSDDELIAALRAHAFRLKPTAEQLGVSRASLYVLIDRCPKLRRASELGLTELQECRERHDGDLDRMAEELEVSRYGLQQRLREVETDSSRDS